jgi:polysaccharide export outer membrane protein
MLLAAMTAVWLAACGGSSIADLTGGDRGGGGFASRSGAAAGSGSTTAELSRAADDMLAISKPASKGYKIGPLDVLEVTVFKVPDLSKAMQVSEAGTINFPLVGEVPAAGRTPREVEQSLTRTLGSRYLQNPQVSVFVKEYNSQRVTIEGAVKKPGVYPIQGGMSLLQAVAIAQGLEQTADDTVVVFREINGRRAAARFIVSEVRTGNAADPQLQSGDVVVAGTSAFKEGFNQLLKLAPLASVFALL